MDERTIDVPVGKGYRVLVGKGLLKSCGGRIASVTGARRAAVITDSRVAELWLDTARRSLDGAGISAECFVFPRGESSKNMDTLTDALEFLAENRMTRADPVIALGGGVAGDLAGFAAAVYQRGVPFVQLPTTLLAAVDSSVGGKTAVNLGAGKNLAGAFKQPEIVVCDTDCLTTLPAEEMKDGLAEAIKYGVLCDAALFRLLAGGPASERLPEIIVTCVTHKSRYVAGDERDEGDRRFLNLGHTVGHAVEKCSDFAVPHGRAVAAGMAMIARAGERLGLTEPGTAAELAGALLRNGLPVTTGLDTGALLSAALSDKKRSGNALTLVMPRRIGECFLHTVPAAELKNIIELGRAV